MITGLLIAIVVLLSLFVAASYFEFYLDRKDLSE